MPPKITINISART